MLNIKTTAAAAALLAASAIPLSIAACAKYPGGIRTRPAQLDTSLEQKSSGGTYEVKVEPLEQPVRAHRVHDWAMTLQRNGKPVDGAAITFAGGMPEHGHGYPTRPKIEAGAGGRYIIRGVKFSMRGWWEMKLAIQAPAGADAVTFNMVI